MVASADTMQQTHLRQRERCRDSAADGGHPADKVGFNVLLKKTVLSSRLLKMSMNKSLQGEKNNNRKPKASVWII